MAHIGRRVANPPLILRPRLAAPTLPEPDTFPSQIVGRFTIPSRAGANRYASFFQSYQNVSGDLPPVDIAASQFVGMFKMPGLRRDASYVQAPPPDIPPPDSPPSQIVGRFQVQALRQVTLQGAPEGVSGPAPIDVPPSQLVGRFQVRALRRDLSYNQAPQDLSAPPPPPDIPPTQVVGFYRPTLFKKDKVRWLEWGDQLFVGPAPLPIPPPPCPYTPARPDNIVAPPERRPIEGTDPTPESPETFIVGFYARADQAGTGPSLRPDEQNTIERKPDEAQDTLKKPDEDTDARRRPDEFKRIP